MTEFNKDSYCTPEYLFNWLNKRFKFDVDGCASKENALCERYLEDDGNGGFLTFDPNDYEPPEYGYLFRPSAIFVNPPYSNPLPFVQRATELKQQGYLVVMLLPADKSTKWYGIINEQATEVIDIIGGRINFVHPLTGEEVKGNNKGSIVAVFDPTMQGLVTRQVQLDFIKKWGE
ncbi:phage N-6-adenine-methyltransferase [Volucribacter amazonae]|uniref:Adenine methyltransferase n=1 Tax=Volucribacter amazonae TaxID=256731 RepID=A0A9X4P8E3_9PAST|nr:phage N-6-adenine-methyltransferase [Volucribacter amazonae]MDG6894545.1 adenine methyltransferase [Volucribacter amazonae]